MKERIGKPMKKKTMYNRGNIYLADLAPYFGSEQGGTRPVLVLQNDVGNYHSPTLIVAPLTGNLWKKPHFPTHLRIGPRGGLTLPSVIMLEQITTIDKQRVKGFMGQLSKIEMQEVNRLIEISLELRETTSRIHLTSRDKYNASGCLDMTAYLAMKNIERKGG